MKNFTLGALALVLVLFVQGSASAEDCPISAGLLQLRSSNQILVGHGPGAIVWPQPRLDVLVSRDCPSMSWDMLRRLRFETAANALLDKIEFRFDIDHLVAEEEEDRAPLATLDELYALVQANQDFGLKLAGHTDAMGSDDYNMDLSYRRAEFVVRALEAKGVKADRLEASFHGESQLLVDTDGKERKNRRVQAEVFDLLAH